MAGVDWAGDGWIAVVFRDGSYEECVVTETFEALWKSDHEFDLMLIDVPIGLPGEGTVHEREVVDSTAREVSGRPSSVFPVPSRSAARKALAEAEYEAVAAQNQSDIDKGLNWQSYYIAAGSGEVDAILRTDDQAREVVIEAHPEVCFRGLLGRQLHHSKTSAAGVGERLQALRDDLDSPGRVLEEITENLVDESDAVEIDDVLDALGLAVTAQKGEDKLEYLPPDWTRDAEDVPMRMAYWAEEPLVSSTRN
ncbi:DUF429 domain-containing protein [Haloarculaceae archaeon H-GB2-1]|nr:DUF429 domain-containing protein [Haloarculaceae archaeon H-GB2-1]